MNSICMRSCLHSLLSETLSNESQRILLACDMRCVLDFLLQTQLRGSQDRYKQRPFCAPALGGPGAFLHHIQDFSNAFTHVKQLSDGFLFDPRSCQAFEYARSPDACMPILMPLQQVRPRCGCSPQHARPRGGRGARGNGTRAQERTGCLSGLRRGQHGRRCVRPAPRFKIAAFVNLLARHVHPASSVCFLGLMSCVGAAGAYSTASGVSIGVSGFKDNLSNFWSGRWSSSWDCNISGGSADISGSIKVLVHYFENGNVQFEVSAFVTTTTATTILTSSPKVSKQVSGSISWPSPEHFGAAVVEFISAQEKEVVEGVQRNFQQVPLDVAVDV